MAVENNMDDELDQVSAEAMQIIMSAGDARVSCNDALKAIAEGNVESARELIKNCLLYTSYISLGYTQRA